MQLKVLNSFFSSKALIRGICSFTFTFSLLMAGNAFAEGALGTFIDIPQVNEFGVDLPFTVVPQGTPANPGNLGVIFLSAATTPFNVETVLYGNGPNVEHSNLVAACTQIMLAARYAYPEKKGLTSTAGKERLHPNAVRCLISE